MKKQLTELTDILHGCVGFMPHEKGDIALRFTDEQAEFYSNRGQFQRARSGAGIFLDFVTDAEVISFDYRSIGAYVITSGIDVWENDVFAANFPHNDTDDVHIEYRVKNPGNANIRIHFPNGAGMAAKNFELGNYAPSENKRSGLALFYGDSITQAAYTAYPSLTWPILVADGLGCEHINRGVGAFIFDENSLPSEADCAPDYLFVEYGFNDLAQFADDSENLARADKYLRRIGELYPSARVYVITAEFGHGAAASPEAFERRRAYCAGIAELAAKYGYAVLKGDTLVPTIQPMFVSDFVHLSDSGNALFAHGVLNGIRKIEGK